MKVTDDNGNTWEPVPVSIRDYRAGLFTRTAELMGCTFEEVAGFCCMNQAVADLCTPEELARQIREYEGKI